ncbi:MAG TPA: CoA-binding protein [Saprospiraceae bacterium]|nr:CoA-binding protein [Saprospiraceae bacterium]
MNTSTIVLGASPNPARYAYLAVRSLKLHGHEAFPVGIKAGQIDDTAIATDRPALKGIDTISLYLNPDHQRDWYSYILSIHPRRIIFNPGTENEELEKMAAAHGIQTISACTLVMLSTGQY